MSFNAGENQLLNFVSYDNSTNIWQCLVPECHTVFVGKKKIAIKRHYQSVHNMNIEEEAEDEDNAVQDNNTTATSIHNSFITKGDEAKAVGIGYNINYVEDNSNAKSNDSALGSGGKGYRTFLVAHYVDYNKSTNISKCLIQNCERPMSGRRTGNIKRHYHKVHNFVIVHDNQDILPAINKELQEYYNNESFGDGNFRFEEETTAEEELNDQSEQPLNCDQYIEYDPLINKSLCKIPGCKAYLVGKKPFSIKRHYGLVHNYDIESNGSKLFDKSKYSRIINGHTANSSLIPIDDLVIFESKTSTHHCLFINCHQVLEKHLATIKRHYHEHHKIIIARDSDNIPHRFYRKRKLTDMQESYDNDFLREGPECIIEMNTSSSSLIKNELLSDDDQPQCSKMSKYITNYMKEELDSAGSVKQEYLSEEDDNQAIDNSNVQSSMEKTRKMQLQHQNFKEKSAKINIALDKQTFFKLCLGLVVERDLPINLFDDDKYFKPLLAPYEKLYDCHIDAATVKDMLVKASDLVVGDLKAAFTNKIVCLEFLVVKHENLFYLLINIRFLEEGAVCNKLIGFVPLTEITTVLPISEYLGKFNIDMQQIYMKTIIFGLQNDESEIFPSIRQQHPDIKNHSVYDIQILYKTFVLKYFQHVKNWETLLNYADGSDESFYKNLKDFAKYIEKLTESEINQNPHVKETKLFFKALQIFWNFLEKLDKEQYVAGDFYRDCLCCELEMKAEATKNHNNYALELYEKLSDFKTSLLDSSEFLSALYLDPRFNFTGSRLLSEEQKIKGKFHLCSIWENFSKNLQSFQKNPLSNNEHDNGESNDDEYALLNHYINDTMPEKSRESIEDLLTECVPLKREPFSLDILKYWFCNRSVPDEILDLIKIVFTFSTSQYILLDSQTKFTLSSNDYEKFLLKFNQNILEKNLDIY